MPLVTSPPPERTSIIIHCLHSKVVDELTAVNTLRVRTDVIDALRFEMNSFDGTTYFATFHYEDGFITVGTDRISWSIIPRTTKQLVNIGHDNAADCSRLNISDPSFSLDDIISYLRQRIQRVDRELTCDPLTSLYAHIGKLSKKRKCFNRSNCQGQRIELKLTKTKSSPGSLGSLI